MKILNLCLKILIFCGIAIFSSCKKISTTENINEVQIESFLNLPDNASRELKITTNALRIELHKNNYVDNFIKINGSPMWNNAIIKVKDLNDFVIYIPTKFKNENYISAFIIARFTNNKIEYELHSRNAIIKNVEEYSKFGFKAWHNEYVLAKFDKIIFNKKNIIIRNLSPKIIKTAKNLKNEGNNLISPKYYGLYNSTKNSNSISQRQNSTTTNNVGGEDNDDCCIEIWRNPDGDACNCNGDEYYLYDDCTSCTTQSEIPDDGPGTGTGGGGIVCPWFDPLCNSIVGPGTNFVPSIFYNIYNPIDVPEDEVADNFVTITNRFLNQPLLNQPIGHTMPRNNIEDMQHGLNGDVEGILNVMPSFTDEQLFDEMESLFYWCTYFDNSMKDVGLNMIQRFKDSSGGSFSDPWMNNRVFNSTSFRNFVQKFSRKFDTLVQQSNGNVSALPDILIPQSDRPVFNGTYNKFHGLQICLNDTEETKIVLDDFIYNSTTHKWVAYMTFTIYDHFGLDKADAIKYQNNHTGFAAWWLLQHTRDYKPFTTIVTVSVRLTIP